MTHTFTYENDMDFVNQMMFMAARIQDNIMEPYAVVRARYPHLSSPAFTMRLKRFGKPFPKEMGAKQKRIKKLFVTEALHEHLQAKNRK